MDTEHAALPYRPCVGIVLLNRDGRVFAGQRRDAPPDQPAWQMPQGGIDPGETVREAGLRELGEETGILPGLVDIIAETKAWLRYDLPPQLIGKLWRGKYRGQEQKWLLMRFKGADSDIDIETEHAEFSEWAWRTPGELPAQIVPFKRAVYDAVFDEFASLL
ncbi:MAG: RNA pyrophosphohydrolase [Pseudomonadota bacterium]